MSSSGEEAADDVSIVPSQPYSDPALATLRVAAMGVGLNNCGCGRSCGTTPELSAAFRWSCWSTLEQGAGITSPRHSYVPSSGAGEEGSP